MKKLIKYLFPYWLKKPLKIVFYSIVDFFEFLAGKRPKNYPPRRLNFVGSVDFKRVGDEFRELFINYGHLKPHDHVLDIGCGVGRMALPLVNYLDTQGTYLGFDIVKKGIEWCKKHITPRHPNFRFLHADIANKFYNERGTIHSEEFKFPTESHFFNFCFATSVFTHMLPAEIEQYLQETARALAKGGTIFFTFFLIPDSPKSYETHCINFQYRLGDLAYYSHKDCPEAEIGYPEHWVSQKLEQNGFKALKIYPGKWRDPKNGLSYQDILIGVKN